LSAYETKSPALARVGDCTSATVYIRRPASDFRSRKENDFPEWLQYALWSRCCVESYNQR